MANKQDTTPRASLQAILQQDEDWAREMIRLTVQEVLEQEMTELLGAGKSERTSSRSGYRAGYYERTLVTRVGCASCSCARPVCRPSSPPTTNTLPPCGIRPVFLSKLFDAPGYWAAFANP